MAFRGGESFEGSSEDYGLVAVKKNTIFNMPADGAREDYFLKIAPFANEVFDGIAMGDAHDVLFDNWAVVEDFGDVVAGCADQFNAALEGLVIRSRTDEGG